MKFTTPCFVRVKNSHERKELDMWLRDIGYVVDRQFGLFLFAKYSTVQHGYEIEYDPAEVIDCGTNIPLFEALAAMNDKNDRDQWFVNSIGSMYLVCHDTIYDELGLIPDKWRKATTEEIINHFKN